MSEADPGIPDRTLNDIEETEPERLPAVIPGAHAACEGPEEDDDDSTVENDSDVMPADEDPNDGNPSLSGADQ